MSTYNIKNPINITNFYIQQSKKYINKTLLQQADRKVSSQNSNRRGLYTSKEKRWDTAVDEESLHGKVEEDNDNKDNK